jgi:hypothetical protein
MIWPLAAYGEDLRTADEQLRTHIEEYITGRPQNGWHVEIGRLTYVVRLIELRSIDVSGRSFQSDASNLMYPGTEGLTDGTTRAFFVRFCMVTLKATSTRIGWSFLRHLEL